MSSTKNNSSTSTHVSGANHTTHDITCKHEAGRQAFATCANAHPHTDQAWLKRHKRLLSAERQALRKLDGAKHVLTTLLRKHTHHTQDSMRIKHVKGQIENIEVDLKKIALRKKDHRERIKTTEQ